jgi:hypothetical protein
MNGGFLVFVSFAGIIQKHISPLSGFVQTSMDGKRQAADNSVGELFVAF